MGWGTCYIDPEGYLNRVRIEQIEEESRRANPPRPITRKAKKPKAAR